MNSSPKKVVRKRDKIKNRAQIKVLKAEFYYYYF